MDSNSSRSSDDGRHDKGRNQGGYSGWMPPNLQMMPGGPPFPFYQPPPTFGPPSSGFGYQPLQTYPQGYCPFIQNVNSASGNYGFVEQQQHFTAGPSPSMSGYYQESQSTMTVHLGSVDGWLRSKSNQKKTVKQKITPKFKIHEYRVRSEACLSSLKTLGALSVAAKMSFENLSEEEWNEKCNQMQSLKKEIETDLEYLNSSDVVSSVKTQLVERQKKRKRLRRRNAERAAERVNRENEEKIVSQQIDDWMKTQEEEAAKIKRDEQLKKEAQSVLSEVTRRILEANNQLELLSGLEKLRLLKSQIPQNKQPSKTIDSFIVFESLRKMWNTKLAEYEKDEQVLRVMLSEARLESAKSEKSVKKEALSQWTELFFGKESSHQFYSDFSQLLLIRSQWDKFALPLSNDGSNTGVSSHIPMGWVLPCAPNSPQWKKLLIDA